MKRLNQLILTAVLLCAIIAPSLHAQMPNTMYFLPGVPQSNRINPATNAGNGFYLGFPGLAPLRLEISSSSLDYNDLFYYDASIDSLLTFAHPDVDEMFLEDLLGNLKQENYFGTDISISIASFGFRAGKNFFAFDINTRVDNKVYYPGGVFTYLFDPDDTGEQINLSGIGIDHTTFNEVSLAWSRKDFLIPNLDFGVRGKLLFGVANIDTRESTLEVNSSMDALNLNVNSQFNVAGFFPFGVTGPLEFSDLEELGDGVDDYINSAVTTDIVFDALSQVGFGADFGVNYRPLPQLRLSASLIDLGFISWNNTLQGSMEFDYDFNGIEVNPFTGIDTTLLNQVTDSITNSITLVGGESYVSRLNPKLFIGASFYPVEKIGFGILSRTEFLDDQVSQQFTGTVNMTTGKFINLSLSYSYLSRTFNNIGAGLSLNAGPFNLYLISDNAVSAALWPVDARSVNHWLGMNLTFGWKKARKPEVPKDRPLIL